ncbi:hypothetical protein GR925_27325 [Streptomyces sp. HUCO-GS316]|uniref:hypothetical protein n=1 Tax=Streptomyces sp. HUCO-GS316 TaxID=2692198 RepID=UPI00136FB481|nr:hypothetical protein [Streptomyces sp. HUCO-GS316]MXM67040.1 hypothetical protein [Streptomyces sp. HUCO-GS316]
MPKPAMDHSERAARDLLNKKVRAGEMDRATANQVLRIGLPFVRTMLATWRREGTSPEWLTEKFQAKQTEARKQMDAATTDFARHRATLSIACAEMYSAVWAGLQADLAQHLAATDPGNDSRPALP